MRADPGSAHRHVAQQHIELGPAFPAVDRIDPYKHAIDGQELAADLVRHALVVYRGLGSDAERRKLLEDAVKRLFCGVAARRASRSPRQRMAIL